MNIKQPIDVDDLDAELHIFDEANWDFFDVSQDDRNYEYFNDIRDTDFDRRGILDVVRQALPAVMVSFFMLICFVVYVSVSGVFDKREYNEVLGLKSQNDALMLTYVDGEAGTSEDIIVLSELLKLYFDTIRAENCYDALYEYCYSTSTFADSYKSFTEKIVSSYDTNDCYARALREFGGFCTVNKIDRVIIRDDGTYYCYVYLNMPSPADMYEYVYLYSYNMTKYFGSNELSEANMLRFLIETTQQNPVPCISREYCLKFKRDMSGDLKLIDDSQVTSTCIESYTNAVSQMTKILKGTLTVD